MRAPLLRSVMPSRSPHWTRAAALAACLAVASFTGCGKSGHDQSEAALALSESADGSLLARTYLLNAIHHADPVSPALLNKYYDALASDAQAPLDDWEQFREVVRRATYEAAPEDVPAVLACLANVDEQRLKIAERTVGAKPPLDLAVAEAQLETLLEADRESFIDATSINERIAALSESAELPPAGSELSRRAAWELARCRRVAAVLAKCEYVDNCLRRLADEPALDSERADSILQAARAALPQFWGVAPSDLPGPIADRIAHYPAAITDLAVEIAAAQSAPLLEQLAQLKADAERQALSDADKQAGFAAGGKKCQARIDSVAETLGQARPLAAKIADDRLRAEGQAEVTVIQTVLDELRREQVQAYQLDAVNRCLTAFQAFNEEWVIEIEPTKLLTDNGLNLIDPALLGPDARRAYDEFLHKLTGDFSPTKTAEIQRLLSTTKKRALSEF